MQIFDVFREMWSNIDLFGAANASTDFLAAVLIAILMLGARFEVKDKLLLSTCLYAVLCIIGIVSSTYGMFINVALFIITAVANYAD